MAELFQGPVDGHYTTQKQHVYSPLPLDSNVEADLRMDQDIFNHRIQNKIWTAENRGDMRIPMIEGKRPYFASLMNSIDQNEMGTDYFQQRKRHPSKGKSQEVPMSMNRNRKNKAMDTFKQIELNVKFGPNCTPNHIANKNTHTQKNASKQQKWRVFSDAASATQKSLPATTLGKKTLSKKKLQSKDIKMH